MPIIRKVMQFGDSKGITLPKSWLENAEQEEGKKIVAVAMEVNGCITLNPVFEKELKASVIPDKRATPVPSNPTFAGGKAAK